MPAHGLRLTAVGIAAGLLLSAAATRLLRTFLYGVNPLDPITFAGTALVWLVIAILASYIPVQRAVRVDPGDIPEAIVLLLNDRARDDTAFSLALFGGIDLTVETVLVQRRRAGASASTRKRCTNRFSNRFERLRAPVLGTNDR